MPPPQFTIFTPTFNRVGWLPRVYESLRAQTLRDFEWVIGDDGSTDGTRSLVAGWRDAAAFPIRYFFSPNRGKHAVYNEAVRLARGELFTVLDSDDAIVPRGLERLLFHWNSIPESARLQYSGVVCLSMNERSDVVGRPFPADVVDCRHYEIEARLGAPGEKWGCHRTSILREFPFPEAPGERYCPDALVWNRIGRRYLVRNVNEPLRVYSTQPGGIMAGLPRALIASPNLARLYYREYLELDVPVRWALRRAVNYVRFSLHARMSPARILSDSPAPLLTAAAVVPGFVLYGIDLAKRALRPRRPESVGKGGSE
jgi:glycosyltransferase involved in cell wall biosynthesis